MQVLITGAGSGIGKAVAERFAAGGHTVYALDVKPFPERQNIIPFTADITDENSLFSVRNDLSGRGVKLDCIINIAGIFFMDNFLEIEERRLKKIFDVNVLGAVRVNKFFFELLKERGKIFITTSEVAPLDALPFNGIYGVSKTALDAYSQALRHEAGLLGIKVVTVRPGAIDTPLASGSITSMQEMSRKSAYFGGQAQKFENLMNKFTGKKLPPAKLADKIYAVALKKRPKCVYTVHSGILLKLLSALPKGMQVALVRSLIGGKKQKKG